MRTMFTVLLGLVVIGPASHRELAAHGWRQSTADVVLEWNQLLQQTVPSTASLAAPRFYSMMHIAMFDAANSVERRYTPYRVQVKHASAASPAAAAAQAAHDVLVTLLPASRSVYDAALAAHLARLSPGHAAASASVGSVAAQEILAWRQDDGWAAVPPPYTLPPFPGLWQPAPGAASFTQYPNVVPFAVLSGTQFLPPPPPTLTSARYAEDFNEVKRLGAAASSERTADQTEAARLFAAVGTRTNLYMLWNTLAQDVVRDRGLDLLEAARLFVLVNVGIIDGVQTTMASKYTYGLWRPVTAVRRADDDLNPATVADAAWTPLLNTPGYPSYAGNQACVASAAARALGIVAGTDEFPITATWYAADGSVVAMRRYSRFTEMAQEQGRSRVYGGIHFTFDNDASVLACTRVTDFVAERFMRLQP